MEEYINSNGDLYTVDEINQAAEENDTTFEDIIEKNGLSQNSKETPAEGPGKKKPVAVKDATVAGPKNTASKSAKSSSASRTKLWDANAEFDTNFVSKALGIQKLTSTNPTSKEANQKKEKFVEKALFEQPSEIFKSPFVTANGLAKSH